MVPRQPVFNSVVADRALANCATLSFVHEQQRCGIPQHYTSNSYFYYAASTTRRTTDTPTYFFRLCSQLLVGIPSFKLLRDITRRFVSHPSSIPSDVITDMAILGIALLLATLNFCEPSHRTLHGQRSMISPDSIRPAIGSFSLISPSFSTTYTTHNGGNASNPLWSLPPWQCRT